MKHFFEQYGGVALGILALLVLIAMITPVGNIIKTSLQGTVQTFSSGMDSQTDSMADSMAEAIKEASTERHYDDAGNILNGIIDRTLYVDGIAYRNLWDSKQNGIESVKWGWKETITDTGYRFEAVKENADLFPYFHEVAYDIYSWEKRDNGQLFYFKDGYKYLVYASNPVFTELLYNYFDENNIAVGPITYTNNAGTVHAKFRNFGNNVGIVEKKYDANSFSLRVGILENQNAVGTIYETEFMVFEIPSDLDVDLSSL